MPSCAIAFAYGADKEIARRPLMVSVAKRGSMPTLIMSCQVGWVGAALFAGGAALADEVFFTALTMIASLTMLLGDRREG